jgi:uncharacterized protein YjbJ (UPF0337 family)
MKEIFVCANCGYELFCIVVPDKYAGLAAQAARAEATTVGIAVLLVVITDRRTKTVHDVRRLIARSRARSEMRRRDRSTGAATTCREQIIAAAITLRPINSEDAAMDKDRIKGSAEQAKGSVKQAAGKVFGDKKLETQGSADKAKGKLQNAVGGLKDSVRGK